MYFGSNKEINRLISNGMSNIYLKSIIEENWRSKNLSFSKFKNFLPVFGELQLTQITLNFETSCCNLKITGLESRLCVAFLLF